MSCLSLHAVNDLPGALVQAAPLAQARRVVPVLHARRQHADGAARTALSTAESELLGGGASPRVAPFSDLRDLGGLLQRAGFALPVTDVEPVTVRYRSPFGRLFADLRAMGATNALTLRHRGPLRRAVLMRAPSRSTRERFADPDGRLRASFDTRVAVGLGAARQPAAAAEAGIGQDVPRSGLPGGESLGPVGLRRSAVWARG